MKQFFTHTLALLLVLALVATDASAQQFTKRKQYNSVGVSLNAMNYFGDITPKPSIPSFRAGATRPNLGLTFTHRFAPRISGRAALSYGRITGDDSKAADQNDSDAKYRFNRNMNFRNDILELSAVGIFDLIENRNNYLKRPDFVPYLFGGVGVIHHNPKGLNEAGNYVALQPLKTEGQSSGYSLTQFVIPFGAGARYKLNRNFDLGLELGFRKTFTDYLDDVSGNYADPSKLSSTDALYFGSTITKGTAIVPGTYDEFQQPGQMRGKSNEKDWYTTLGISVNYILAPKVKSPKFR
ncbi:Outer membrane protein beta-barrel domain-containing protein [Hymenobacter gelipurpurascens]|uniref:Outer membrane protein beta-barrel domain-containing protein n=1 Tax=Hymenobacter gelipurpurascens TaxID=89968 RepID=A0A212UGP0_9BACT|nr:DUF6089 family protein [Hymenobacter gelipurpurascens]SNC77429.1 Outer membrane protein beta-barrel domain-containing protein [Hymenobacter gelipurpurascens]